MKYGIELKHVVVDSGFYQSYKLNKNAERIEYHKPLGEGDKHYVDITIGGEKTRYFNIIELTFLDVNADND